MAGPAARMMAGGGPDQRTMDFKGSGKRLVARFGPERLTIYGLLACVVLSVGLSVIGPKILGHATENRYEPMPSSRISATSLA